MRSGASYEECAGRHIISQGGYYQYDFGFQGAFRDPLQHMLPMIYADPELARDVLLYSAAEQPRGGGQIPYAHASLCRPAELGTLGRPGPVAAVVGRRVRAGHPRPRRSSTGGSRSADGGGRLACGATSSSRTAIRSRGAGRTAATSAGATGDWSDFSTNFLGR